MEFSATSCQNLGLFFRQFVGHLVYPRKTFRQIIDRKSCPLVYFLAIWLGIAICLSSSFIPNIALPLQWIFMSNPNQFVHFLSLAIGVFLVYAFHIDEIAWVFPLHVVLLSVLFTFLFFFTIATAVLHRIGRLFKGIASYDQIRAAIIWATGPNLIFSSLFGSMSFVIMGTKGLNLMARPTITTTWGLLVFIAYVSVWIWSLWLMTINVAQVQRFSIIKAGVNVALLVLFYGLVLEGMAIFIALALG